jgi:hypothetical protein
VLGAVPLIVDQRGGFNRSDTRRASVNAFSHFGQIVSLIELHWKLSLAAEQKPPRQATRLPDECSVCR